MQSISYPNLSEIFNNEVYKKYFDEGGNVQTALSLVNSFLNKYPYYPEAIIFKARMLIVAGELEHALEYLKIAKKIDKWRVVYSFDIAEILYKKGEKRKAIGYLKFAFESLFDEAIHGLENFLISIELNEDKENEAISFVKKEMIKYVKNDSESISLDRMLSMLNKAGEADID
ncbi:hypothetical protein DENIS_0914 [Desulfonema ishimotonii]|uniref:Tetratricopeptide repeat protein n=1 Tax=Desulfonema ishimotonii TaxID=45657 RepID=A0A401FSL7_9BACT|nr:hypothetical protein [Desulfonema ishimotonii]GBC59972.1 hypothetical protein DENIS_0914 [Desulfonema ishimotonii]